MQYIPNFGKLLLLFYLIFSYKILNLLNFIVAYFLNPKFQYRHGVGSDSSLIQTIHDVFAKLDSNAKSVNLEMR